MRRFWHRCGLALPAWALVLVVLPGAASAQELLFDWSPHRIQITSDFTGAPIIVFGVVDGPGDVIVVVRGPDRQRQRAPQAPLRRHLDQSRRSRVRLTCRPTTRWPAAGR